MSMGGYGSISPRNAYILLALLALVNVLPIILYSVGGDILGHLVFIDCFNKQFWQGDVYPRWCFSANVDLGAPFFVLYAPFPYYVTAFLKPLEWLGGSLYTLYATGCVLATLVTAFTCFSWMRDMVSVRTALWVTAIFLFAPYRSEAVFYRAAYAELWQIAWLPLICKYTRRIVLGETMAIRPLAMSVAVSLLTHFPCTMIALLLNGLYGVLMSGKNWRVWRAFAVAVAWGGLAAAFYLVPAVYYQQFLNAEVSTDPNYIAWPNLFPRMELIERMNLWKVAGEMTVVVPATLIFSMYIWLKNKNNITLAANPFFKKEMGVWCVIAFIAAFLLFPVSEPLYQLTRPISAIIYPWRMQIAFAMVLSLMMAVRIEIGISTERRKQMIADLRLMLVGLLLMSYFLLDILDVAVKSNATVVARTLASDYNTAPQYRTRWTDSAYRSVDLVNWRYDARKSIQWIQLESEAGKVVPQGWGWDGIRFTAESSQPMTVLINHTYFPMWKATIDAGEVASLRPQNHTGRMLVDVPAGSHAVTLTYSIFNGNPWLIGGAYMASAMTLISFFCRRRQDAKVAFSNG